MLVLTTHYRTWEWTELLMRRLARTMPDADVFVLDQDRTAESRSRLERLGVTVLSYPKHPEFAANRILHDHPIMLTRAVRDLPDGEFVLFDSDAHPFVDDFVPRLRERLDRAPAVMALDWSGGRTHPCFMAFGAGVDRNDLQFDDGWWEDPVVDTGRRMLHRIPGADLLPGREGFGGRHGTVYMDAVYHHGLGSYHRADRKEFHVQIDWRDEFFRKLVLEERWTLGPAWLRYAPRESARRWRARWRNRVADGARSSRG